MTYRCSKPGKKPGVYLEIQLLLASHHQAGCLAADLHRKVRAAVPWVDLAHRGKIQAIDGRLDCGDILRMVHKRHWLCVRCAVQPDFIDPAWVEIRIKGLQAGQEFLE